MAQTTSFTAGNSNYSSRVTLGIDRVDEAADTGSVLVYITTRAMAGNGFYLGSKDVRVTLNGGETQTFNVSPGRSEMNGAVVPVSPGDSVRAEVDYMNDTYTATAEIPQPTPAPSASDSSTATSSDSTKAGAGIALVGAAVAVLVALAGGGN